MENIQFQTFSQFKNWFLAIFEIVKNGIWPENFCVKLIYLISRAFLPGLFFNFLAPCIQSYTALLPHLFHTHNSFNLQEIDTWWRQTSFTSRYSFFCGFQNYGTIKSVYYGGYTNYLFFGGMKYIVSVAEFITITKHE